MRKIATTVTAGLLLVAAQGAAAESNSAAIRVGDRIGSAGDISRELAGVPLPILLIGAAIIAAVVVSSDDDSESD